MAALCNRAGHYIFALWFFLSSFFLSSSSIFFPRLISAVADWLSAILPHMVWPWCNLRRRSETSCWRHAEYTGRKTRQKNRNLGTIAQLCRAISSQLRHASTIGKEMLSSNISSICPHNIVNFGRLAAEIVSLV